MKLLSLPRQSQISLSFLRSFSKRQRRPHLNSSPLKHPHLRPPSGAINDSPSFYHRAISMLPAGTTAMGSDSRRRRSGSPTRLSRRSTATRCCRRSSAATSPRRTRRDNGEKHHTTPHHTTSHHITPRRIRSSRAKLSRNAAKRNATKRNDPYWFGLEVRFGLIDALGTGGALPTHHHYFGFAFGLLSAAVLTYSSGA